MIDLTCLCGVGSAAGSVGLGTSALAGLRWVVGENINGGTANILMTNEEVIASAYTLCHTNNAPTGEGAVKGVMWSCGVVMESNNISRASSADFLVLCVFLFLSSVALVVAWPRRLRPQ